MSQLGPWLCKNSRRYNRTRNFGLYGHAESKKNAKICLPPGITTKSDFVFTRPRPFAASPIHQKTTTRRARHVRNQFVDADEAIVPCYEPRRSVTSTIDLAMSRNPDQVVPGIGISRDKVLRTTAKAAPSVTAYFCTAEDHLNGLDLEA